MTKWADCVHWRSSNISNDVADGSVGSLIATALKMFEFWPSIEVLDTPLNGFNGGRGMEKLLLLLFLFMSTSCPWDADRGVNDGDGDGVDRNPF